MLFHPQISIDEVAALAAALEANSEHPLAAAIVAFAAARLGQTPAPSPGKGGLETRMSDGGGASRRVDWVRPAKDVESEPGKGIRGWVAPGESAAMPSLHHSPAKIGAAKSGAAAPAPGALGYVMSHVGRAPPAAARLPVAARAGGKGAGLGSGPAPDVKVVVGNKQMLALEGMAVPQTADEWMREREVCCHVCRQRCACGACALRTQLTAYRWS